MVGIANKTLFLLTRWATKKIRKPLRQFMKSLIYLVGAGINRKKTLECFFHSRGWSMALFVLFIQKFWQKQHSETFPTTGCLTFILKSFWSTQWTRRQSNWGYFTFVKTRNKFNLSHYMDLLKRFAPKKVTSHQKLLLSECQKFWDRNLGIKASVIYYA